MAEPIISLKDLQVGFEADEGFVQAVQGISFDIEESQTLALVGESGSGKTVVSHAILGILSKSARIKAGHIWFCNPRAENREAIDLASIDQNDPRRRSIRGGQISIIFQEPMSSLSPLHTIGDQISEAYRLHIDPKYPASVRATTEMLSKVGFPNPERAFKTYPFELSGGLRQRAMIAMALICRPSLLIADEPTTALDVTVQAQILKLLKDLQAELKMAILFITHDLGVVANIADRVAVMYRGRLMEVGDTEPIFENPQHAYLKGLLRAVPTLSMDVDQRLATIHDKDDDAAERKTDCMTVDRNKPILSVKGLSKTFYLRKGGSVNKIRAVDDISFDLCRGECLAIVGESGSGKSTVSKMIMRGIEADAGTMNFRGKDGDTDIRALNEKELIEFRKKIQYVFQDPFSSLNPRMTVQDIISEPFVIQGIEPPGGKAEIVKNLLSDVGLDPRFMRRYPHSFSGGQRQRIGIARALALKPEILILDEPVSALDVSVQAQILNLLKDLQREYALSYLFIAHNLAVVRFIAQTVGVICKGKLVELASTVELFENPQHPYTKSLLAAVPEPDLDKPLPFESLASSFSARPDTWPHPFKLENGASGNFVAVSNQHFVRKSA